MAKWFVYILEGSDGTFYSGITWRISLCPEEKVDGLARDYIYRHGLKQISRVEAYEDLQQARKREEELKAIYPLAQPDEILYITNTSA